MTTDSTRAEGWVKVYTVTVKDGTHVCGKPLIAANSVSRAERLGQEWAAKYLGGWPEHYKATAKPKVMGGMPLQVFSGEGKADVG